MLQSAMQHALVVSARLEPMRMALMVAITPCFWRMGRATGRHESDLIASAQSWRASSVGVCVTMSASVFITFLTSDSAWFPSMTQTMLTSALVATCRVNWLVATPPLPPSADAPLAPDATLAPLPATVPPSPAPPLRSSRVSAGTSPSRMSHSSISFCAESAQYWMMRAS